MTTNGIPTHNPDKRLLGAGDLPGYIRLKLAELDNLPPNVPKEVQFDVAYGDGNDLKPGDQVDVVTAWQAGYWHIWGMHDGPAHQNDQAFVITLPGVASNDEKEKGGEEAKPAAPAASNAGQATKSQ